MILVSTNTTVLFMIHNNRVSSFYLFILSGCKLYAKEEEKRGEERRGDLSPRLCCLGLVAVMVGSLLRVCFRHIHFAALCCRAVRGTGGEGEWLGVKSMKRKYAVLVKYSAPDSTSAEGNLGERVVVTVCRRDIEVDAM